MEPMKGWFSSVSDERPVQVPALWPLWVLLAIGAVVAVAVALFG